MMILNRSLTSTGETVLLRSSRSEDPFLIPPFGILSRSELPVENDVAEWAMDSGIFALVGVASIISESDRNVNLPLSRENSPWLVSILSPLSLFTERVLTLRPSSWDNERLTTPSTR